VARRLCEFLDFLVKCCVKIIEDNLARKGELHMGKVVGFELSSQEPRKAAKFYERVFGWEISEQPWDYWEVVTKRDGGIDGGISKGPQYFPHGARIQIEVDSIDDTLEQAVKNGAMVVREKMEFEKFYLAYLVDPTGVGFGLIEKR
jgi:uncharacterized protein